MIDTHTYTYITAIMAMPENQPDHHNDSSSDEEDTTQPFMMQSKIIDKINDTTFMIKITFRELIAYTQNWCYNRSIDPIKVTEIYESLCESYHMPFILQAVYDEKHNNPITKLLLLDGQHRKEAVRQYIETKDVAMDCPHSVWICVYNISNSETTNTDKVIGLFKKINNNRIFNSDELPDTFVVDLIKAICNISAFQRKSVAIKTNENNKKAHSPCIHKKELHAVFNGSKDLIKSSKKTIAELVSNIQVINHKLSLMKYEDLYTVSHRAKETDRYKKAVELGFFLNLQNSKYTPEVWIRHIVAPDSLYVNTNEIINV